MAGLLINFLASGITDSSGNVLEGGKAYVYEIGTTTKVTPYSDNELTSTLQNPFTLESDGSKEVYVTKDVRVLVEDALGNTVKDIDALGTSNEVVGDTTFGNDSSDTFTLNSGIKGNLLPRLHAVYNIGTAAVRWLNAYFVNLNVSNDVTIGNDITVTGDAAVTGDVSTSGDLSAGGSSTFSGETTFNELFKVKAEDDSEDYWEVDVDGADSDKLKFSKNGVVEVVFDEDSIVVNEEGSNSVTIKGANIGSAEVPSDNTAYANTLVKAWAATTSGASISDGANLSVTSSSAGIYVYSFRNNMANANYAVLVTLETIVRGTYVFSKTTSGFSVVTQNIGGSNSNTAHSVMVVGEQ